MSQWVNVSDALSRDNIKKTVKALTKESEKNHQSAGHGGGLLSALEECQEDVEGEICGRWEPGKPQAVSGRLRRGLLRGS